ncbi:hypothetical protein ACF5W4_15285 [Bacillota bacterium Lsc_1132]
MANGRGNMTRAALKWILTFDAISCVIPGFKNVKQVADNLETLNVPNFNNAELLCLREFYQKEVHKNIRGSY